MSFSKRPEQDDEFQTSVELEGHERPAYLARTCRDDEELKEGVENLLNQVAGASKLLNEPRFALTSIAELTTIPDLEIDPLLGERVGAYRIEREIGRGGMGTVYLAERADEAFRRRVAIKVIKRGMDTDFVLKRFRHERRILAKLEHPNITLLLDGGATPHGLPYFVMEYVEGKPLYTYCDTQRISVRARVRLFCQICDAVDYAHKRQIIHRDIKPSNILVTNGGIPKLFDFGIAKLLDPEPSSESTPLTATAVSLMTIDYASPEQIEGARITHLTDVYSLGVLLYELLCGHRPYHFQNRSTYEIARVICEKLPEPPSIAVNRSDNLLPLPPGDSGAITISHVCEVRGENPETLSRQLQGGLDSITLKALRKDPAERYQTAAALREDLEQYLEGRSISAPSYYASTPETPGARSLSGMPTVAVLPFKVLGARNSLETDEYLGLGLADALITRLSNVRRVIVRPTASVLKYGEIADPFAAGGELGVSYIIDGNLRRAGDKLRVTVQLLNVSEGAARWAGKFDENSTDVLRLEDLISEQVVRALVPQLTREEQQQLAKRGTNNPKAYAAYLRGRYFLNRFTPEMLPKAIESFQMAIALDPNYALAHVGVADFYNWACIYGILPPAQCSTRAQKAASRALELDESVGEAHAALGLVDSNEWRWAEAEQQYLRALELNPSSSLAHEWYSSLLVGTGRFTEGLTEIERSEELDPLSLRTMTLKAWTTYQLHRYHEALAKADQMIVMDRDYAQGHLQRGINLVQLGRHVEAIASLRRAVQLMASSVLPRCELCFGLAAAGRVPEARLLLGEIKQFATRNYVKPYFLAVAHSAVGDLDTALAWFQTSFKERDPWLIWFGTDPKLERLRHDERFLELFRRTENPLALDHVNNQRLDQF